MFNVHCLVIISEKSKTVFSIYSKENEINGKFRVTSEKWNDNLADPNSIEYQSLAETMKTGLYEMLAQERGLLENADFKIDIIGFRYK